MPEYLTYLDTDTLTDAGLAGYSFGYRDRVRFYELDALNHVNNVVFLRWFETIRVAYFQHYGFSKYGPDDPMLVVRRATADFFAPAHQNDEYIVAARTRVIKPSSFVMEYSVASNGTLWASSFRSAAVVAFSIKSVSMKPGATQLARIPCGPISAASEAVIMFIPPLVDE